MIIIKLPIFRVAFMLEYCQKISFVILNFHFIKVNSKFKKSCVSGRNHLKTMVNPMASKLCDIREHDHYMGRHARKPVFRVLDKVRLKASCSAMETS